MSAGLVAALGLLAAALTLGGARGPALLAAALVPPLAAALASRLAETRRGLVRAALVGLLALLALDLRPPDRLLLGLCTAAVPALPGAAAQAAAAGLGCMLLAAEVAPPGPFALQALAWTLLLAHYLRRRHAEALGLPAPTAARLLVPAAAIVAVASGALVGLPLLRSFVRARVAGIPSSARRAGLGVVTDLRAVTALHRSQRIVARVVAREPRHLRGHVYSSYADGRWTVAHTTPFAFVAAPEAPAPGPPAPHESLERVLEGDRTVYLPLCARLVEVPGCRLERNRHGTRFSTTDPVRTYVYEPGRAAADTPPATPAEYLELPPSLGPAVPRLARAWCAAARTPEASAAALMTGFATGFRYTLEPGRPRPGLDPVARFLTDTRAGHCEYFASALALVLRAVGIPARYVTGYVAEEQSRLGSWFVVRDSHAHAWVEAWLPGRGWVELDPTPGDLSRPRPSPAAAWADAVLDYAGASLGAARTAAVDALTATLGRLPSLTPYRVLAPALLLGALVLAVLARFGLGRGRGHPSAAAPPHHPASRALADLEALVAVPRPPQSTAREWLARLDARLPPEALAPCRELVESFSRARYRGDPWDGARAARLLAAARAALGNRP